MIMPRANMCAVLLDYTTIAICGGTVNPRQHTSACEKFDLTSHAFSPLPDMIEPRSNHATVHYRGNIVALGGCSTVNSSQCEQFDPVVCKWTPFPPCDALCYGAKAAVAADKIYAVDARVVVDTINVYDGSAWGCVSIEARYTGPIAGLGGRLCILSKQKSGDDGRENALYVYDIYAEPWTVSCKVYEGTYHGFTNCVSF